MIGFAVDGKFRMRNAVGVTAYQRTLEIVSVIFFQRAVSQNHVAHGAVAVGCHDADQTAAEVDNFHRHTGAVFQCV